MRAAILCLFLAACASPAPTTYSQGAYRPAPPAFNPVTDAPITIGQPGYARPGVQVEPGPKPTRLLPETPATRREPGIWASDAPSPSASDDGKPVPLVLGVRLPYWLMQDEPDDREHTRWCAARTDALLRKVMTPAEIAALSEQETRCLAMRMYNLCSTDGWEPRLKQDETLTKNERSVLGVLVRFTAQMVADHCGKDASTTRVQDAYDNARKAWWE